jgi:K+-sensing histidine kinase KdpD
MVAYDESFDGLGAAAAAYDNTLASSVPAAGWAAVRPGKARGRAGADQHDRETGGTPERVVRRAWRSSQRLSADLDILVVRDPGREPTSAEREQLKVLRRLASVLGAHLLVEEGDDLADVAIRTARERGTTYVPMGAPSPRRGVGRLAEPVPQRIVPALPDVDVRLVAERSASG